MDSPLTPLLEEGIISEVLGRLQSGKEAEVFIVRYADRVVAAKVYKDRAQRSFKNKAAYQEGRSVRNSRDQRAIGRRSSFGRDTEEEAWKSAEVDAMYRLHAADVRVPAPVLFFEGVLLMDLVLGADGATARRLIDTRLSVDQANAAYHDMLVQLVRMLSCDLIHGDLSPYNVLWGVDGPTIIDFPQIVSAAQNSNSERFFLRDAENILGYFRAVDPRLNARRGDAPEIWRAYMRRELTADFLPTGRNPQPPPQRPLLLARPHVPARSSRPQPPPRAASPRPQQKSEPRPQHHRPVVARSQRDARSASPLPQDVRSPRSQRERHGARNGGHGQARRPAPEVIVRPRAAAPPREAPPARPAEPAGASEPTRKPRSKRG